MSSKTKKVVQLAAIGLMALLFLITSAAKLSGAATENFHHWGYNEPFMYAVGVVELICAIALMIKNIRRFAIGILILLMIGAAFTHLRSHEPWMLLVNAAVIAILLLIAWLEPHPREV